MDRKFALEYEYEYEAKDRNQNVYLMANVKCDDKAAELDMEFDKLEAGKVSRCAGKAKAQSRRHYHYYHNMLGHDTLNKMPGRPGKVLSYPELLVLNQEARDCAKGI